MTRARLVGAFSLLAACASSKPEPLAPDTVPIGAASSAPAAPLPAAAGRGPWRPSHPARKREVDATLKRVTALRGLAATKAVPGLVLQRDDLVDLLRDKALREYPAEALKNEGDALELLGQAPIGFDYLGDVMRLLDAQLEGLYEPNDGTMYLAADLAKNEEDTVLAHELVHALQDQHYDLRSRSTYQPGKTDETMALACLAEGDATSLMIDAALQHDGKTALDLPGARLRQLMEAGLNAPELQRVPRILRTTLIAPYVDGLAFVHALRRRGGWVGVDSAWKRPPSTTEQILHVEKWDKNEPAIAVPPPTATALGGSWKRVDEDTAGELNVALLAEEWLSSVDARLVAAGWGGDRSALFLDGDLSAFAMHVRYDDATAAQPAQLRPDAFAERAFGKLSTALRNKLGPAVIDQPDAVCIERAERGPLFVSRRARSLFLSAGPMKKQGTTRKSGGSCAQAQAWAAEVLGP